MPYSAAWWWLVFGWGGRYAGGAAGGCGMADAEGMGFNWRKLRARFRRWLPASFAGLAFLVFLGAALYPPTTHEGLTCRVPRVLHWLAEGHWHWITTPNARLNDRPCGLEWLAAPLLLFTRSDRGLFLINFIPLLLLPGLIFSVFTRLGVRPRVAWHWMWLLADGLQLPPPVGQPGQRHHPGVLCFGGSGLRPARLDLAPARRPLAFNPVGGLVDRHQSERPALALAVGGRGLSSAAAVGPAACGNARAWSCWRPRSPFFPRRP